MKRIAVFLSNIRLINLNFVCGGKFDFCLFGGITDSLKSLGIGLKINPVFFLKFRYDMVNYYRVKIVSGPSQ